MSTKPNRNNVEEVGCKKKMNYVRAIAHFAESSRPSHAENALQHAALFLYRNHQRERKDAR